MKTSLLDKRNWDERHHNNNGFTKPLPAPAKFAIKSLHGGPIKPRVSSSAPYSMSSCASIHYRKAPQHQDQRHRKRDQRGRDSNLRSETKDIAQFSKPKIVEFVGEDDIYRDVKNSAPQRLEAVRAELAAARAEMTSVENLAQLHQATLMLQKKKYVHDSFLSQEGQDDAPSLPCGIPLLVSAEDGLSYTKPDSVAAFLCHIESRDNGESMPAPFAGITMLKMAESPSKDRHNRDIDRSPPNHESANSSKTSHNKKCSSIYCGDISRVTSKAHESTALALDIEGIKFENQEQRKSGLRKKQFDYLMSESGTLHIDSFEIGKTGMLRASDNSDVQQTEIKKNTQECRHHGMHESMVVLGVLGQGASSVVTKALHVPTLRLVAQKRISIYDNEKRHQMVRELKALYDNLVPLTSLTWGIADAGRESSVCDNRSIVRGPSCQCIVSLYDAYMDPNSGDINIIVEYMDGGSLQDIVDTGGCDCESVLSNISFRILTGLAFLHSRRQIHRDIKPANLLINHMGHVKVSNSNAFDNPLHSYCSFLPLASLFR